MNHQNNQAVSNRAGPQRLVQKVVVFILSAFSVGLAPRLAEAQAGGADACPVANVVLVSLESFANRNELAEGLTQMLSGALIFKKGREGSASSDLVLNATGDGGGEYSVFVNLVGPGPAMAVRAVKKLRWPCQMNVYVLRAYMGTLYSPGGAAVLYRLHVGPRGGYLSHQSFPELTPRTVLWGIAPAIRARRSLYQNGAR